ncbi:MAG: TIM barrel protein [Armatimonadetes bacterium]|nr:TIM barrel protein [Armatimonadota bacterium]
MRIVLHPAVVGSNPEMVGDYCKYLGVTELFYHLHDVVGYQGGLLTVPDALNRLCVEYAHFGLRFSAVNEFLPNEVDGIERRCETLPITLEMLAREHIETLIVFVLHTDSEEIARALKKLYRILVDKADKIGVKIATHGHWCDGHVVWNFRTMQKIIEFAPGSSNGICLCTGCSYQAGDDVPLIIRQMSKRIHAVHVRDTTLSAGCDLEEMALGTGAVPIREIFRALKDVGYDGIIIPEHLGTVQAQANMEVTHAHAIGYLQGMQYE